MEEVMLTQKEERVRFKKEINKLARTLIYYESAMLLASIIVIIYLAVKYISVDSEVYNAAVDENAGLSSILGIALGMIIILIYRKKDFIDDLKTTKTPITVKSFLMLLLVLMALRLPYTGIAISLEAILNNFGYSFISYFEAFDSITDTPLMILYSAILGPIAEEIVFRGAVLRKLEGRGRIFAIVISSILFGVFHVNIPQGIYATFAGIVFAYIALEYSIIWAIAIHVINNSVTTLIILYDVPYMLDLALDAIFLILGAAILIKNRNKIKSYLKTHKTEKYRYRAAFTSVWLLLFIALNLLLGVIFIGKVL